MLLSHTYSDDGVGIHLPRLPLQVYENYTSPLGIGFVCASNHYDMDLPHRQATTNATKHAVGYRRSDTYAVAYHNPLYV